MQSAYAIPNHRRAGFDAYGLTAFLIVVGEVCAQCSDQIVVALHQVVPRVGHRIFEIEHHAGRTRIEHFDHELRIVRGAGHLIALVRAPWGKGDPPIRRTRFCCVQVRGQLTLMRASQHSAALRDGFPLPRCKLLVQWPVELRETRGQVALGMERRWRPVDARSGERLHYATAGVASDE